MNTKDIVKKVVNKDITAVKDLKEKIYSKLNLVYNK